jgi:hypothetical protein
MADIKNRNIYRGSSKNYDPIDPRRSSAVEMFNVDNIAGNLDNALVAGASKFLGGTTVGQQFLPLQSIRANWVDNTKALCTAKFGFRSSRAAGGFDGISLSLGTGSARWIQLPYDESGGPAFRQKKDTVALKNGGSEFRGGAGSPNGKLNIRQGISTAWIWRMPIWIIDIKVTLKSNPASEVGHYLATINSDPLIWDGFSIPKGTLKFKGADIKYVRDGYQVAYTFAHRRDGWFEQWPSTRAYIPEDPKKGPQPDYKLAQTFEAVSYVSPGFGASTNRTWGLRR